MSKISQQKKAAKAKAEAADAPKAAPTASAEAKFPNFGKCCTCKFYGKPCHKTNDYVPRKAEKSCYKFKKA